MADSINEFRNLMTTESDNACIEYLDLMSDHIHKKESVMVMRTGCIAITNNILENKIINGTEIYASADPIDFVTFVLSITNFRIFSYLRPHRFVALIHCGRRTASKS